MRVKCRKNARKTSENGHCCTFLGALLFPYTTPRPFPPSRITPRLVYAAAKEVQGRILQELIEKCTKKSTFSARKSPSHMRKDINPPAKNGDFRT